MNAHISVHMVEQFQVEYYSEGWSINNENVGCLSFIIFTATYRQVHIISHVAMCSCLSFLLGSYLTFHVLMSLHHSLRAADQPKGMEIR